MDLHVRGDELFLLGALGRIGKSRSFVGEELDFSRPINSYGICLSDRDFRNKSMDDSEGPTDFLNLILYRSEGYTGKYFGVDLMFNYSLFHFSSGMKGLP